MKQTIINRIVLRQTKQKKNVIYGRQAMNKQLPPLLQRSTKDWDIWSRSMHNDSHDLEHRLDKKSRGDHYASRKLAGASKDVYSVYDKSSGEKIADFSEMPSGSGFYVVIGGIRWQTLSNQKTRLKKILADPQFKYRHEKAKYDLWTIEKFEHQLKTKQPIRRSIFDAFIVKPKYQLNLG